MRQMGAARRAEWRVEAVPAEVDLSRSSVERALYALGLLRAAVAARSGRFNPGGLWGAWQGRMWWKHYTRPAGRGRTDLRTISRA